MCRLYHNPAGDYVRLCYLTGYRGEHWAIDRVTATDPAYAGLGCVRVQRSRGRRAEADARLDRIEIALAAATDRCTRCGDPMTPLPDGLRGRGGECAWCTYRERGDL